MGANDHVEPKRRKKSTGKQSGLEGGYDAEFRGYINVNLSDAQKAAWAAWAGSADEDAWFEAAVSDGVNISVRVDPKSGGYVASATQRREGSPNAGLCVTARAREPLSALSRLVYCLSYLAGGDTWESVQPMADPDRW